MARQFVSVAVVALFFAVASLSAQAATPNEAVGFFGIVTGVVKSRAEDGTSFVLTVSKAEPSEKSTVKDSAPMVGKDLTLGTRMPRKDGVASPHVEDVAYIKTLNPGDKIVVQVFAVHSDPSILRIVKPGEKADK